MRKRRRRSDGDDGSGGGDDGGDDDGVGEAAQKMGEQESERLMEDEDRDGTRPATAPSLEEEAGMKMWRRNEEGRGVGVGVRSDGGDGATERTGSASQLLFAEMT